MVQKKEGAEKTFGRSLQEFSPICRVFGFSPYERRCRPDCCAQKNSDSRWYMEEMQQTCQRCGLTRLFSLKADGFRKAS